MSVFNGFETLKITNMKTELITKKIERIINGYTDRLGGSINQSKVKMIAERIVKKCNLHDVSNNEVAVCPKCASKDVIWTVYCNNCNEAM